MHCCSASRRATATIDDRQPAPGRARAHPMDYVEMHDPGFLRPDWVVTAAAPHRHLRLGRRSRSSWTSGRGRRRQPDDGTSCRCRRCSATRWWPTSSSSGPRPAGVEVGERVVLNPWLTCGRAACQPICPACARRRPEPVLDFRTRPIAPGIHTGTSRDAPGGFGELLPAHDSMLFPVPDAIPDEVAVFADPFAVSLHSDHAQPAAAGRQGAGLRRGRARHVRASRSCTRSTPTSTSRWSRASPRRTSSRASSARRWCSPRARATRLIEAIARLVGRAARARATGCRWRSPAASTWCTTRSARPRRSRSARACCARAARSCRAACTAPTAGSTRPLYFKELHLTGSNAFGIEEVDGVRKHGIQHYLDLVGRGPHRPDRHAHAHLPARRSGATRSTALAHPGRSPARSRSRSTSAPTTPALANAVEVPP